MAWTVEERRAYNRGWVRKRRDAWFADKSCVQCGSRDDLHLHHVDATKKASHHVWSWSEERRLAELAKCEVLCGGCHRRLHAQAIASPCGTNARYRRGCRCSACREAHRVDNARFKKPSFYELRASSLEAAQTHGASGS